MLHVSDPWEGVQVSAGKCPGHRPGTFELGERGFQTSTIRMVGEREGPFSAHAFGIARVGSRANRNPVLGLLKGYLGLRSTHKENPGLWEARGFLLRAGCARSMSRAGVPHLPRDGP